MTSETFNFFRTHPIAHGFPEIFPFPVQLPLKLLFVGVFREAFSIDVLLLIQTRPKSVRHN